MYKLILLTGFIYMYTTLEGVGIGSETLYICTAKCQY